MVNFTSKTLILSKDIHLSSIHEYIDTLYIIIDIAKAFTAVAVASITVSKPFIATQKAAMLGSRYQRTSLTSAPFENGILTMNIEFTFIPKVEAILITKYATRLDFNLKSTFYTDNLLKPVSSISVNDIIYTIIVNTI